MRTDVTIKCVVCGEEMLVTVMIDPGVHSFSNGDPGYPGSTEVEFKSACKCPADTWTDEQVQQMEDDAVTKVQEAQEQEIEDYLFEEP